MTGKAATLTVEVRERDGDVQELDELTTRLRRELLELDVHAVDRARGGPVPEGAKAVDVAAIGTLLVTLSTTSAGLTALVGAIRSWLGPSESRSVRLEIDGDVIDVKGLTGEQHDRLIDDWINRRATR